jgi:hypothetical protein
MSDVEAVCLTIPLRSDVMKNRTPEEMVRSALARGKIGPDQEKWAMEYATRDPKGFEVFVNKAVAIPPATPAKDKEKEIDETQRMINALFGIDDETFKKYGPRRCAGGCGRGCRRHAEDHQPPLRIEEPRRGADAKDLDDTQRHINRLCGVDDETFLKHGG